MVSPVPFTLMYYFSCWYLINLQYRWWELFACLLSWLIYEFIHDWCIFDDANFGLFAYQAALVIA